ncbi:MAG: hypothetical protein A2X28_06950 [Elusimicrobia bacterium GWA2_56_46]|nr:MAG: hypothetical protein A2X28_06950 [Elusimicrobia bacterium GWA2_56_46]OGR54813.1 MAG: hypothetical protein A2X39_11040 [Elusimicrobia bacterium GWC2_56_31]HBW23396.1 hypothetical protein [Elusimicrobiota bacterium]
MEKKTGVFRRRANSAKKQSFLPQTFTAVPEGYAPDPGLKTLRMERTENPAPPLPKTYAYCSSSRYDLKHNIIIPPFLRYSAFTTIAGKPAALFYKWLGVEASAGKFSRATIKRVSLMRGAGVRPFRPGRPPTEREKASPRQAPALLSCGASPKIHWLGVTLLRLAFRCFL